MNHSSSKHTSLGPVHISSSSARSKHSFVEMPEKAWKYFFTCSTLKTLYKLNFLDYVKVIHFNNKSNDVKIFKDIHHFRWLHFAIIKKDIALFSSLVTFFHFEKLRQYICWSVYDGMFWTALVIWKMSWG